MKKSDKNIQESMVKKGGRNPKPITSKPENVIPPSQKFVKKKIPPLQYYKIYKDSQDVKFETKGAACFDVAAYLKDGIEIEFYDVWNNKSERIVENNRITILSHERVLVPTGLILDIPIGYSIRTHPRSSTGIKLGLSLPHNEGIIDSDYYHQFYMPFINNTKKEIVLKHNQKITQAEMIKNLEYDIYETKIKPVQKTNRIGGFGSTGQ